jgi:hypothetical protein
MIASQMEYVNIRKGCMPWNLASNLFGLFTTSAVMGSRARRVSPVSQLVRAPIMTSANSDVNSSDETSFASTAIVFVLALSAVQVIASKISNSKPSNLGVRASGPGDVATPGPATSVAVEQGESGPAANIAVEQGESGPTASVAVERREVVPAAVPAQELNPCSDEQSVFKIAKDSLEESQDKVLDPWQWQILSVLQPEGGRIRLTQIHEQFENLLKNLLAQHKGADKERYEKEITTSINLVITIINSNMCSNIKSLPVREDIGADPAEQSPLQR